MSQLRAESGDALPARAYNGLVAIHWKGAVVKPANKVAVAILAVAGLSGCASTRIADLARAEAAPAAVETHEVSRPAPSYGSRGGYRYRRLVKVTIAPS